MPAVGREFIQRRLPAAQQLQLLRATLLPSPAGCAALLLWLPSADLDTMDADTQRLMPLLYKRLRIEGIDRPLLPRLLGLKKHVWLKNQLLMRRASTAIGLLQGAGIEVMAIKGLAMNAAYYGDSGLRSMNDCDLLVPWHSRLDALQLLTRHGWTSEFDGVSPQMGQWALNLYHAAHLYDPLRRDLDLHWNLTAYSPGPAADADFWDAAGRVTIEQHTVHILNPADQLLHICAHGAEYDPLRWVPDAHFVLERSPGLDWERLLFQSRKLRLTLVLKGSLEYLQKSLEHHIPPDFLRRLSQSRPSFFERFEYRQLQNARTRLLGILPQALSCAVRLPSGAGVPDRLLAFCRFLCLRWNLEIGQLPAELFSRARRKILRRAS